MFRSLILGIEDAMRMLTKYIMAMDTWNKPLTNPDEEDDVSLYYSNRSTITLHEDSVFGKNNQPAKCACAIL